MRTIRDVLRLRLDAGLSEHHTARSLGVPRTTVQDYGARFRASGVSWPLAATMDDGRSRVWCTGAKRSASPRATSWRTSSTINRIRNRAMARVWD